MEECVRETVTRYLDDLNGEQVNDLYNMVIQQVEKPLIEVAMKNCMNNQSKAARLLGINRNTLRKKLAEYQI
ncbi:MAG: Fis family transcriptional regulator [Acidiferrobacterales bacterium]|nr:Fis family transcriptional regulator [Acidiferrobacterales bacterium]